MAVEIETPQNMVKIKSTHLRHLPELIGMANDKAKLDMIGKERNGRSDKESTFFFPDECSEADMKAVADAIKASGKGKAVGFPITVNFNDTWNTLTPLATPYPNNVDTVEDGLGIRWQYRQDTHEAVITDSTGGHNSSQGMYLKADDPGSVQFRSTLNRIGPIASLQGLARFTSFMVKGVVKRQSGTSFQGDTDYLGLNANVNNGFPTSDIHDSRIQQIRFGQNARLQYSLPDQDVNWQMTQTPPTGREELISQVLGTDFIGYHFERKKSKREIMRLVDATTDAQLQTVGGVDLVFDMVTSLINGHNFLALQTFLTDIRGDSPGLEAGAGRINSMVHDKLKFILRDGLVT